MGGGGGGGVGTRGTDPDIPVIHYIFLCWCFYTPKTHFLQAKTRRPPVSTASSPWFVLFDGERQRDAAPGRSVAVTHPPGALCG